MREDVVTDVKAKVTLALKNLDSFDSDFLTIEEAAKYLRCHHSTVRNLCKRGDLKAVRLESKRILIPVSSVKRLIAERLKDIEENGFADPRFTPHNWNGGRRPGSGAIQD